MLAIGHCRFDLILAELAQTLKSQTRVHFANLLSAIEDLHLSLLDLSNG